MVGVAWLAMCATLASAAPATAPASLADKYKLTEPDAVEHFQRGNAAYKSGVDKRRPRADRDRDLERAITEYTSGQAVQDRPVFDFNLGLAYKALGRTEEAIEHLQRFLDLADETVSTDARADAERKLAALDPGGVRRADLAKKRATVPPPAPALAPSPKLQPVAEPERAASAPSTPPSAAPGNTPPAEITATEAPTPHGSVRWSRVGGWGLAGIGVVGAGITTWLLVDANSLDSQADDAQTNHSVLMRHALASRADTRRRAAVIVGIGSGAVLATGALILLLSSDRPPEPTRTGWNLGITGNGLAVSGRF